MRVQTLKNLLVTTLIAAILCLPANAQSRKRVLGATIQTPGRLYTSVTRFNHYSYGTGNVGRGSQYNYGGVLSSGLSRNPLQANLSVPSAAGGLRSDVSPANQYRSPNYNITRPISQTPEPVKGLDYRFRPDATSPADKKYLGQPTDIPRLELPRPTARSTAWGDTHRLTAAGSALRYLDALRPTAVLEERKETDKPVSSLAPDEPGTTRDLIVEGEQFFRKQDYRSAINRFKMAMDMSMGSPESMLCLMHTYFATSRGSYSLPAYYLSKTLEVFPELPLVPLHPKHFYGSRASYTDDFLRLEKYCRDKPNDPEARLVLAYLKWRDGKGDDAGNHLKLAMEDSQDKTLSEAIMILWDGIAAEGGVSGKLQPASRPATTQPASSGE